MTAAAYRQVIPAPPRDRLGLFLETANRLGTPVGNVEKDFWVCWTLNALYRERPAGGPRLLFKGGTSLSKGYGLIRRFSEDIDITVFRDDLNGTDPDGQTLLVWYPEVEPRDDTYVQPSVRIESGARSALDPHRSVTIQPYINEDAAGLDLSTGGVTAIDAARTFWDKVVIAHGLRRWHERRGVLRQEGQRVSRHYYDLHCLLGSDVGRSALADRGLGADCVRHARTFFDRRDYDLASAEPGTFAIMPTDLMVESIARDYANTTPMIFGAAPAFEDILASTAEIEDTINSGSSSRQTKSTHS